MSMTLLFGDSIEQMRQLDSQSIDLILADLPYGTTRCKWDSIIPLEPMWEQYRRIIKPRGAIVLTACQPFTSLLVMSNPGMFKHEWIWHKSKSGSAFTAKFRPMAKHESVLVFGKGSVKYNPQMRPGDPYKRVRKPGAINNHQLGLGKRDNTTINEGWRYPDSVIFFQQKWRRQDQIHPTQKPVDLMEYLIRTYSDEGDTVLDNTMGSGTTGLACINTGRAFVGIDNDPAHFATAQQRLIHLEKAAACP